MAKEVASVLSPTQLAQYGNIIGPFYKSWQNNYMSYFTRAQSGYSAYSGQENPFLFDVWNYYQNPGPIGATGPLLSVAGGLGGNDLIPGQYLVSASGATSGYGAVLNFTVQFANPADPTSGAVTQILVVSGGSDYTPGDVLPVTSLPTVSGLPQPDLKASVGSISSNTVIPAAGYSQCPRRFYQNQVSAITPPQYVNNPQAIAYSFLHPVATSQAAPPIDTL
jgi:hypothetical protein